MFLDGERPKLKPGGSFGTIMVFATLVLSWFLLGVPMLAGIRVFTGEGWRGDLVSAIAFFAIFFGSFWALGSMTKTAWRSNEQRQIVYVCTHISIWGAALLMFWPQV